MSKTCPLFTITLAIFLLTMGALAQKSESPVADYFPLRVGDSWTYHSTMGSTEYSQKVLKEEKQTDGTVRYLVEKVAGAKVETFYSKAGGWVLMNAERYPEHEALKIDYEPAKQVLKNPLTPGAKWDWKGKDITLTDVEEENEVTGPEDITVPAGKFRGMKVVTRIVGASTPMIRTNWYADGVGLVKSTTEAGKINYGWELKDYSFKKKDNERADLPRSGRNLW